MLLFFTLFFAFNVYSQNASGTSSETSASVVDESSLVLNQADSQNNETASEDPTAIRPPSVFLLILRMLLVLAFVIVCIYFVLHFLKQGSPNSDEQFLRLVSSVSLGQGRFIHIVSLVDQRAFIVGSSDSSVNLIGEVTDKELIDAMNLYADKNANTKRPKNFSDILSLFMGQKAENAFSGQGESGAEMIKKRRLRFNGK